MSGALAARPLPRYSSTSRKRAAPARVQEAELRPSLLLAKQAIGEVEAELDAAAIPYGRMTYNQRGECHVYVGDELVAWSFAVTDEPAALSIETLTQDVRERLRQWSAAMDAEESE